MAGEGSRFTQAGYTTPKPLIEVKGKTLIEHSIETLGLDGRYIFITKTYSDPSYNEKLTEIFSRLCPNYKEIRLSRTTSGASETSLKAEDLIDPSEPLVITNSDQYFDWNPEEFIKYLEIENPQSCIGVYTSTDPKNSFAEVVDGEVVKLVEKVAISDVALTGFHYWRWAADFFRSAKSLLSEYETEGYKEPYISLTYNYLISNGIKVETYSMPNFFPLGTPEDIETYETKR